MSKLTISPTEGQKLLVRCFGNDSPSINDIGEVNAKQIIHHLQLSKKRKIVDSVTIKAAIKFVKELALC